MKQVLALTVVYFCFNLCKCQVMMNNRLEPESFKCLDQVLHIDIGSKSGIYAINIENVMIEDDSFPTAWVIHVVGLRIFLNRHFGFYSRDSVKK